MMGLLCLTDGMALGHVVQSYVKEATIAFTACRDVVNDPEFYASCIEDSFNELRDAAAAAVAAGVTAQMPEPKPAKTKAEKKKPAVHNAAKSGKVAKKK
jgi:hypothetical protein